jgi:hypothetical protein
MPASRPLVERFWEKVDQCGPIGPYLDTPCWLWTASTDRRGYGLIGVAASKPEKAHRVSWTLNRGPIPRGCHVLHRCHDTRCVNPDHLYLGNCQDNARDRVNAKRTNAVQGGRHPNALLSEDTVVAILQSVSDGASQASVAKRYRIASTTVHDICAGASWSHVDRTPFNSDRLSPGVARGSSHPSFRVTPEMRSAMKAMRADGTTYRAIAAHFQVSPAAAFKACKADPVTLSES